MVAETQDLGHLIQNERWSDENSTEFSPNSRQRRLVVCVDTQKEDAWMKVALNLVIVGDSAHRPLD
jgi:hypothetical protein